MADELFPNATNAALYASIRSLFKELGGSVPVRVLAEHAIAQGLIPPDEIARCTHRGVQDLCKRALKVKTANGVPFAKPIQGTEDESDSWTQLELMTYEELAGVITREVRALVKDYHEVQVLVRFCEAKFGRAPAVPQLIELEEA